MAFKGNETKRWPLERFRELIVSQLAKERSVRLFVAPDEGAHALAFADFEGRPNFELLSIPLAATARSLSECTLFIGNDSGIAHLAAGLGVGCIVLCGMTNPTRLAPIGAVKALRPSHCPSCHDEGTRRFSCVKYLRYRCIAEDISSALVNEHIERALAGGLPELEISQHGRYSL